MAKPDYVAKGGSPLDRKQVSVAIPAGVKINTQASINAGRVVMQNDLVDDAAKHRARLAKQREYQRAYRLRQKAKAKP